MSRCYPSLPAQPDFCAMQNDTAVPGGNATLHLENSGFRHEIHAKTAETPEESKRLRLSTLAQSINRLSKLQRKLLIAAYQRYAAAPGLAPAETPSQFGSENAPEVGVAHLYSHQAVAGYLGCQGHGREGHGNHFTLKLGTWRRPDADLSSYRTAQATISRSFARLESRGLAERMERGFMYLGGIQLTEKGVALGRELTGIAPVPRNWTAKATTEGCQP